MRRLKNKLIDWSLLAGVLAVFAGLMYIVFSTAYDLTERPAQERKILAKKVSTYAHEHPDYTITKTDDSRTSFKVPGHVKWVIYYDSNVGDGIVDIGEGDGRVLGTALADASGAYIFSDNKKGR